MVNQKKPSLEDLVEQQLADLHGDEWPEIKARGEQRQREVEQREEQFHGEIGLANMEATLGVAAIGDESSRIDAVAAEVERLVTQWEAMTPSALMKHRAALGALFRVSDKVTMAAVINHGRLPNCWWAALAIRLRDMGVYNRLTDQIFRETQAEMAQDILRDERSMGGKIRAAKDAKSSAKAGAHKLWKERRAGLHPKLRTNEQFAMEVMRRWPVLTSIKVICGWCTAWNKEAKSQSAS